MREHGSESTRPSKDERKIRTTFPAEIASRRLGGTGGRRQTRCSGIDPELMWYDEYYSWYAPAPHQSSS